MLDTLDHFDLWPVDRVEVLTLSRPESDFGYTLLVCLDNGTRRMTVRLADTTLKMLARALADMVDDLENLTRPQFRSYYPGP